MSNQVNSMGKGLTVKDLVKTGIFTALVFVFVLVGGIFFAPNPVLTFFMPAGSGLLAGPVFLLMIAKVQKRWSLSIMGVVICIIWFVTGMHWAFALGYLIMAVVADFVAGAGQYRARSSTAWLTYCSPLAVLDRISFSLLIPTAGRRPCWGTELSRAILTPCRQLPTPASWLPCLPQLLSLLQSVLL